eukprot:TRINITY_DN27365_c0_g1_i4.p1 TRINITY_DN27365_c0_g1~~TRINITY_DN27365_c0_g1_i4.p1  ORF type:complete len:155 (-),score=57.98 TRINITY_DN27365_c0_g1_i4:339-803(-)
MLRSLVGSEMCIRDSPFNISRTSSPKLPRTIAVSNFVEAQLECLNSTESIQPAVNQMRLSVGSGTAGVVVADAQLGIVVQAYSPLGSGTILEKPEVLAIAKAHNVSSAQVALRWILQKNATINTQSTNPAHLAQDVNIFDFELTVEEMHTLDSI